MTVYKWSQTANSNSNSDATISIPEGMAPSGVNDGMRAMMAAVAKYRDDQSGKLITAGSSGAYSLTTNQVFSSLATMDMQTVCFRPHVANGANPSLNVDGLGAKNLVSFTGTTIPIGAMQAGQPYAALFINAANEWRMMHWLYNNSTVFYTVATLPIPANYPGMRAIVSDSTVTLAAGLMNAVVGGGANVTPVYNDASVWRIG